MKILITGASRGIGATIAKTFAQKYKEKAEIALLDSSLKQSSCSNTSKTIIDALNLLKTYRTKSIIPIEVDVQDPNDLVVSVNKAITKMGGLDILINNTSVLYLNPTIKEMNLLYTINTQASILTMKIARDALTESKGSIVTISPPINLAKLDLISPHPEYTISKYSMTLATLGNASNKIRANCIWPRYVISTKNPKLKDSIGNFSNGRLAKDFALAVVELAKSTKNAQTLYDDEIIELLPIQAPIDRFAHPSTKHLKKN